MPKVVKFTTEYSHQLDGKFRKSWPTGWTGELDEDVAFGARKALTIEFTGTPAEVEDAEAWFADRRKAEKKAQAKAAAAAAAAAAGKKVTEGPEVEAGDDADKLI